jgi:hypothetical protein
LDRVDETAVVRIQRPDDQESAGHMSVDAATDQGLRAAMVIQLVTDQADMGLTIRPEAEAALRRVPRHRRRDAASAMLIAFEGWRK